MSAIGIIGSRELGEIGLGQGADYVEPAIVGNVVLMDGDGRPRLNPAFEGGARYPSFAILLPGELRVADPAVEFARVEDYFGRVFSLLAEIARPGAKVVFGSGAARHIPAEVARDEAEARFASSLVAARDAAASHGLVVLLEPLHQGETNLINSIAEAVRFLDRYGIEHVPLVADVFHLEVEREPLEHLARYIDRIGHAHIADAGRGWLGSGAGIWPRFVATLRASGYSGPISLECNWGRDVATEVAASVAALRTVDPAA